MTTSSKLLVRSIFAVSAVQLFVASNAAAQVGIAGRIRRRLELERVYRILKKDGYRVSIVQNPTTSLADYVAITNEAVRFAILGRAQAHSRSIS
jgi:hypothetical protein